MDSWNVALIDQTAGGVVPAADLRRYAAALQRQVDDDLAPAWQVRADISVLAAGDGIPAGTWPLKVVDSLGGLDGVHLDDGGQPYAEAAYGDQLSVTLSHELLEMLVDPLGSRFIQAPGIDPAFPSDVVQYLVEVADPCEPYSYEIDGVAVADFILPAFFVPGAAGTVDVAGFLPGPLTVLPGCYLSWYDPADGNWHEQRPNGAIVIGPPTPGQTRADRDRAFGDAERGRHDAAQIYRTWPGEVRRAPG